MKSVIVIPARFASMRYPGKPLVLLRDGNGIAKPLIQRSWEAARAVCGVSEVHILTDDNRIYDVAKSFGASVLMTDLNCENGTMRCANALMRYNIEADLIINFQGDAPLTPPWFVKELINHMQTNPESKVATPVIRCDKESYGHFLADRKAGRVGATTAVFGADKSALYFSKEIIPYISSDKATNSCHHVFHHVGLYAYRRETLRRYTQLPKGPLEQLEGLEQLRFLENTIPVTCVEVVSKGVSFWELNTPEDVARIEDILSRRQISTASNTSRSNKKGPTSL